MKGIVFNLLEDVVTAHHGVTTWEALLDAADLDGAYTSLGSYDDAQLFALVTAASKALGIPPNDVVKWFGSECIPRFYDRYPQLFAPYTSARQLAMALNDIIHPEVRKLYPGADVPVFDFTDTGPQSLRIGYSSPRRLCAFAEGLLEGTARHYGETVTINQPECIHRGDVRCILDCSFQPVAP